MHVRYTATVSIMEKLTAQLEKLTQEFQLFKQELQLTRETVTNATIQTAEIHSIVEDLGAKLDIIGTVPLVNPTPKQRATRRAAVAQTPVITDTNIPAVVDQGPETTPAVTPRPASSANIKAVPAAKKKYNRDSYFKELYMQDPNQFNESMTAELLATLPADEPARRAAVYKILTDDKDTREWLIEQARLASAAN